MWRLKDAICTHSLDFIFGDSSLSVILTDAECRQHELNQKTELKQIQIFFNIWNSIKIQLRDSPVVLMWHIAISIAGPLDSSKYHCKNCIKILYI